MDAVKTLLRSVTRTFFKTKQILIIDALLVHSVLHADDLAILLSTQPKEIRSLAAPLEAARLLSTATRTEARVGSTRSVQREYYYIPYHPAVDAIKWKMMKLRDNIAKRYPDDVHRKVWLCPHCNAEWDQMEVLDKPGPDGFDCHRCGHALVYTGSEENAIGGPHEKVRRLNEQFKPWDDLMKKIDREEIPENRFDEAWERKKDLPRDRVSGQATREFIAVGSSNRGKREANGPGETDARRLDVLITSGEDGLKVEEAEKERRRREIAKQNTLPVWHTSVIGSTSAVSSEEQGGRPLANGTLKQEDQDNSTEDKKPTEQTAMQTEMEAYLAELEREKAEERRLAAEEDAEDVEGEDDFEEVLGSSNVNTPMSSQQQQQQQQQPGSNGTKRGFDESPPSSDANTPVPPLPELKKPRVENGKEGEATDVQMKGEDSGEEDDGDFEDAI